MKLSEIRVEAEALRAERVSRFDLPNTLVGTLLALVEIAEIVPSFHPPHNNPFAQSYCVLCAALAKLEALK